MIFIFNVNSYSYKSIILYDLVFIDWEGWRDRERTREREIVLGLYMFIHNIS